MEPVVALVASLRAQQASLADVAHRLAEMRISASALLTAVNTAEYALAEQVRRAQAALAGGSGALAAAAAAARSKPSSALAWHEHVLETLKLVEGAWPFLRANLELAGEAAAAAAGQADVADRIALPLGDRVAAAQAAGALDAVPRVSLQAFNDAMAKLAARVTALGAAVRSVGDDMRDAAAIFETLLEQVARLRERTSPAIAEVLQSIISHSAVLVQLTAEVQAIVRGASGDMVLLHPDVVALGADTPSPRIASATARLAQSVGRMVEASQAM